MIHWRKVVTSLISDAATFDMSEQALQCRLDTITCHHGVYRLPSTRELCHIESNAITRDMQQTWSTRRSTATTPVTLRWIAGLTMFAKCVRPRTPSHRRWWANGGKPVHPI
jgi:hypothetical protein